MNGNREDIEKAYAAAEEAILELCRRIRMCEPSPALVDDPETVKVVISESLCMTAKDICLAAKRLIIRG